MARDYHFKVYSLNDVLMEALTDSDVPETEAIQALRAYRESGCDPTSIQGFMTEYVLSVYTALPEGMAALCGLDGDAYGPYFLCRNEPNA